MSENDQLVVGGVDTHRDTHVAAVVDTTGRVLDTASFPADVTGYEQLGDWLGSWGQVAQVGIEGTGSYGAGLSRHLMSIGVEVTEVNRPNRQLRRRYGKTDATDAEGAARAVLSGQATGTPKTGNGPVEAIRMLSVARRSAVKARTQAINQLHALVVTAPDQVKDHLFGLSPKARVKVCAAFRPGTAQTTIRYAKQALRLLARRYQALTAEITQLDTEIRRLCVRANPALLAASGIGPETAATLLITAGDNPHRLTTEASFAALCGTSPVQASSGRTVRHRLNRGGDRQANHALWRIAMVRLRADPRTIEYAQRRQTEGKTRKEIIRCLKRYITRQVHQLLTNPHQTPSGTHLRCLRQNTHITLAQAATALHAHPTRLSQLERGQYHNHHLATRYQTWLTTPRTPI